MAASAASSTQDKDPDSGLESTASVSSLSSSVNEQVEERKRRRMERVYYDVFADVVFKFSGGTTIRFNKGYLASKTDFFLDLFTGSSSSDAIEIVDYDFATFKLFLDCLLGIQKISVLDALMIFPIAWTYRMEELVDDCIKVLEPTVLNENVVLSLNLALFCKCKELTDEILEFLMPCRIYKILDDKNLYCSLEPESMAMLLNTIKVDSNVVHSVFDWGTCYLEKNKKWSNLKLLFKEHNISSLLKFSCFETVDALLDFNETFEPGRNYFDQSEIFDYLRKNRHDCRKSRWLKIDGNICERFVVRNVTFMGVDYDDNCVTTTFHITRNPVVFYDWDEDDIEGEEEEGNCSKDGENSDGTENGDDNPNKNIMISYEFSFKWNPDDEEEIATDVDIDVRQEDDTADFSKPRTIACTFNQEFDDICDVYVDVKYTFHCDGRVLMTSCNSNSKQCFGETDCIHFTSQVFSSNKKILQNLDVPLN